MAVPALQFGPSTKGTTKPKVADTSEFTDITDFLPEKCPRHRESSGHSKFSISEGLRAVWIEYDCGCSLSWHRGE